MKRLLVLFSVYLIAGSVAKASGCGDTYTVAITSHIVKGEVAPKDYKVIKVSADAVTIQLRKWKQIIVLKRMAGQESEFVAEALKQKLYRVDVGFYEGNDCGPAYNCASGEYLLTADPENPSPTDFAWPAIEAVNFRSGPSSEVWLSQTKLLKTWSGLKPVDDYNGKVPPDERAPACLLGNW
jgi:hypothetical protein